MRIALASLSYLVTAFALVLLAVRVRQLIAIYKKGQPDPTRSADRSARLKNMLKEVLGHTKMLNFTGTGIAHWFVMIGFGALFGTLVTAYGQVINPDFALPLIGHWVVYELFAEFIAIATGVGIVTLIGIRQVTRFRMLNRFAGSGMGKAYYVEATILAIVFCVFALRGLEGALAGERAGGGGLVEHNHAAQEDGLGEAGGAQEQKRDGDVGAIGGGNLDPAEGGLYPFGKPQTQLVDAGDPAVRGRRGAAQVGMGKDRRGGAQRHQQHQGTEDVAW